MSQGMTSAYDLDKLLYHPTDNLHKVKIIIIIHLRVCCRTGTEIAALCCTRREKTTVALSLTSANPPRGMWSSGIWVKFTLTLDTNE